MPTGITAGVLRLVKYGSRALEALAKLCGKQEGLDGGALLLEARERLQMVLEKAYEAGHVTEEDMLDGAMALGKAHMWSEESTCEEMMPYFRRAKGVFVRLLGKDHAETFKVTQSLLLQTTEGDEVLTGLRALWERVNVTLPDEPVSYDVANQFGRELRNEGKFEEAKVLWLAALEGRRRVLWEEHKDTLGSVMNMGIILTNMEDYEGP